MQMPSLEFENQPSPEFLTTEMVQHFDEEPDLQLEAVLKVMLELFGKLHLPVNRSPYQSWRLSKGPFEVVIGPGENLLTDLDVYILYVDPVMRPFPVVILRVEEKERLLTAFVIEHILHEHQICDESILLSCGFDLLDILVCKAKDYTRQVSPEFHWDI